MKKILFVLCVLCWAGLMEVQALAVLPAKCLAGRGWFDLTGTPGYNLYTCNPDDTWTLYGGAGGNHALLSTTHTDTVAASSVLGDLLYGNATPAWQRLAGNITTAKQFLTQTGTGAVSAAPVWGTVVAGDVPNLENLNGTLDVGSGGTGAATTATLGRYLKGDGSVWGTSTGSASGVGTPTACTNQFVTSLTLNSDAAPTSTCTTLTAASAQLANQGTTTTVLHGNAAGNPSWGAIVGGDMTAGTVTSTQLATANKTITKSITILDPTTGETNQVQWYWPAAVTLNRIACSTDAATSVTINFDERAEATPNTAGVNTLSANLVCDTNSQTSCAAGCDVNTISDSGIAADVPHNLQIISVSGTVGAVRIHLRGTIN